MSGAPDPIRASWHVVAPSAELTDAPVRTELLGRPLAVFRSDHGAPAVIDAACTHRGTDLTLGDVVDGTLRCPYHAWAFDGTGRCTRIPSLGADGHIPDSAHTTAYPAVERDGFVWASLDAHADPATIPAFPVASGDHGLRVIAGAPMVWRTSAGRHVENILDLAHFPFVHPATFGCEEAETVEPHHVAVTPGRIETSVRVRTRNPDTPDGPLYPALGPIVELGYRYVVELPYRVTLEFTFPDGMRRALHEVVTPNAADRCTIHWTLLVESALSSPDAEELAFAHRVFAEDQPVVESQPPGVPIDATAEVHVPADRLAVAYRRAMRELGVPDGARV